MMWHLQEHQAEGVFWSEHLNGFRVECWTTEALLHVWGRRWRYFNFDLHPYYAFIASQGSVVNTGTSRSQIAFGTLEECMATGELVLRNLVEP